MKHYFILYHEKEWTFINQEKNKIFIKNDFGFFS